MSLLSLPSELLIHILNPLSTPELLSIAPTASRIFSVVTVIIRSRMAYAAAIPDHILSFDCFHPTLRFMKPSLHCTHLQTRGLESAYSPTPDISSLSRLRDIYSHFRVQSATTASRQQRRPGDIPGSRTYNQSYFNPTASIASVTSSAFALAASSSASADSDLDLRPQHHETIHLEAHELFSQLVIECNVVSGAPTILRAFTSIEHGVVRVWRDWLEKATAVQPKRCQEGYLVKPADESNILWLNLQKSVGLRVRVTRRGSWSADRHGGGWEDVSDSYDIEFEELLVRSSHLLLKFEDLLYTQSCLETEKTAAVMGTIVWG